MNQKRRKQLPIIEREKVIRGIDVLLNKGEEILNIHLLSERFQKFAALECKGSSSLYEFLSLKIADDNDMLELSSNSREGQPVPNLLLGAVHYLLLKGKEHTLNEFYPSIVEKPKNVEDSFSHFKGFCNYYRNEIISILKNKLVQTNEVRRCAYLYPIFCYIYNKVKTPLSLVEIGSSAGLQLLWDKYTYSYGDNNIYGNDNSPVHLQSKIRKGNMPFILQDSPPVDSRIGLDLHICDLAKEKDYLWLMALIWPEHNERLEVFENAAKQFNQDPPKLVEGDGVNLLKELAEHVSNESTLCIYHTHVANQMTDSVKEDLLNKVREIGRKRNVFHVYNNIWDRKLHLDYFINAVEHNKIIGETDGHGRWFDWEL